MDAAHAQPEVLIQLQRLNVTSSLGLPYAHLITTASAISAGNVTANTTETLEAVREQVSSISVLIFKTIIMVAIMLLAVLGNLLVITSVLKFEKLRIIANSFIVSLAFADLLVAILVMPFSASQEIAGKWVFGKVMCDIFNANDVLFSTASLLHLCCISMDRYIAITDPFQYESKMTKRRVCIMLMCAWGASAMISQIPIHLGWYTTDKQKEEMMGDVESCQFVVNKPYAVVSSLISFWTPTIIMVFTYVKIFREARRQEKQIYLLTKHSPQSLEHLASNHTHTNGQVQKNGNGTTGPANPTKRLTQDRKKMRREHKAAKTLGVIMGAFILSWLPFFLWYLTSTLCDHCYSPPVVVTILFWIGYLNSGLNPVIYAFFNRDFRFAFKRLLRCHRFRCCDNNSRSLSSSNSSYNDTSCHCCCWCRHQGPEANALAHYPHPSSGRSNRGGADYEHSSTPSPRSKRFYDTVEQPPL